MNQQKFNTRIELGNLILSQEFDQLAKEIIQIEKFEQQQKLKRIENQKLGVLLPTNTPGSMLLVRRSEN